MFEREWRGVTFGDALDAWAHRFARETAIIHGERRLTYAELAEQVDGLARGLLHLGVEHGDRVGIWLPNIPEWVVAEFAIPKIGAVAVALNTRLRHHDLSYILKHAGVSVILVPARFLQIDFLGMLARFVPDLADRPPGSWRSEELPELREIISVGQTEYRGVRSWDEVVRAGRENVSDAELARRAAAVRADELAFLLYTSGTTSFPKGAMRTHDNVLQHAAVVGDRLLLNRNDRVLCAVPFVGTWGCHTIVPSTLSHGAALVCQEWFDPEQALHLLEREAISVLHGVDSMYLDIMDLPALRTKRLPALRTGIAALVAGGGEALMARIRDELGMTGVVQAYGLSEANAGLFMTRPLDPEELRFRCGGWIPPEVEVEIADPATGAFLKPGEEGEILVRGYNVMPGYYRQPDETRRVIDDDGWLHTGDLGVKDERGFYQFVGRLKDMIKTSGFNVSPREVEDFLMAHPGIRQAAVVGVPDPRVGEVIHAFIIRENNPQGAALDERSVIEYCRGQISNYKVPRRVRFVTSLPVTEGPHGAKVRKGELRELALKLEAQAAAEGASA